MVDNLSQLKDWLLEKRRFRTDWFAKDPQLTPVPEEALTRLPDDLNQSFRSAVNQLLIVPEEKAAILEQLDKEISNWREKPHLANNSMVVLAHPVTSVARILTESLMELQRQQDEPLETAILDWVERPPDIGLVKQEIKEKLDWDDNRFPGDQGMTTSSERKDSNDFALTERKAKSSTVGPDTGKVLAVIPNLSWCFLRSAEGLDGIDYLQETLLSDRRQFWTMGCGRVSWEYLKSTLKFHAYCGKTIHLPVLNGQQLRAWLKPVVEQFDVHFIDAALHKRFQHPDSLLEMKVSMDKPVETLSEITQEVSATVRSSVRAMKNEMFPSTESVEDDNPCSDYFARLAEISDGVSVVALQLFIKSLRYRKITETEKEQGIINRICDESDDDSDNCSVVDGAAQDSQIIAVTPKLPPLPELSQSDLYLLYSLMLHGDLTILALAHSLGDPPQVVNNQVQILRNQDVIEQKDGVVKINPVHYPKLKQELANNNFIIEVS